MHLFAPVLTFFWHTVGASCWQKLKQARVVFDVAAEGSVGFL
jgi:hypothetical protein